MDIKGRLRDFMEKRIKMVDHNRNTRKREADAYYEGYVLAFEEMEGFALQEIVKYQNDVKDNVAIGPETTKQKRC